MVNTEAERQFYLSLAGVRMWYARSALPGAAPSPDFVFPEEEGSEPVALDSPPPATVSESRPSPASSQHLTGLKAMISEGQQAGRRLERNAPGADEGQAVTEVLEPQAEDASPIAGGLEPPVEAAIPGVAGALANRPVPQLSLRFWLGDHTVLASETSGSASARLLDALAGNILGAAGDSVRDYRTLDWPVFANPAVGGNEPQQLQDCLRRFSRDFGDRLVVLLGLTGENEAWVIDGLGDPGVVFAHGLGELAVSPERKRELWAKLKPVVAGRALSL